jgi:peptidoglycan hydrolase-like protein with peptidoglycan-binding domain
VKVLLAKRLWRWPAQLLTNGRASRESGPSDLQPNLGPVARRHDDELVDGIFGPRTDEAVRGFQQALSLNVPSVSVDGIVGPVTWRALVSGTLAG